MTNDIKVKMVKTKTFNKNNILITSSLHYYYSLAFLSIESKYWNYRNLILQGNNEHLPPSIGENKIYLAIILHLGVQQSLVKG